MEVDCEWNGSLTPPLSEDGEDFVPSDLLEFEPSSKRRRTIADHELDTDDDEQVSCLALFKCHGGYNLSGGNVPNKPNRRGPLASGILQRFVEESDPCPGKLTEPLVKLFGERFITSEALLHQGQMLFFMLRKQVLLLKGKHAESGVWPVGEGSGDFCVSLREDCVSLMSYITVFVHRYINRSSLVTSQHPHILQQVQLPGFLVSELQGLLSFLGRLTSLPTAAFTRAESVLSVVRLTPVSHLLHLHLDLMLKILETLARLHRQLNQGDESSFEDSRSCQEILLCLEETTVSLLWDFVTLALPQFSKSSTNDLLTQSPFPCSCFHEFWIILVHFLDFQAKNTGSESFWSVISSILCELYNDKEDGNVDQANIVKSLAPRSFTCKDPLTFCWWMLIHIAPLYHFDSKGECVKKKGSVPGNWLLVQDLLKKSLNSRNGKVDESVCRFHLKCCLSVSRHWTPSTDIILWLWDHFQKKMNEIFTIPGQSVHNYTIINLSAQKWMEQCVGRSTDPYRFENESSYNIFLRIITAHLSKLLQSGSLQAWRQIKGRFYSKFHKKRMLELTGTGLSHFTSLFLTLSHVAELEDVANKMCTFLDLLEWKNLDYGRRTVLLKGLFSLFMIYQEKKVDARYLAVKLSNIFSQVCREFSEGFSDVNRRQHLWDHISLYLDSCVDVLEYNQQTDLGEAGLIGDCLGGLFTCCRDNKLKHLLTFVQAVVGCASRLTDLTKQSSNDVSCVLWRVIYPAVYQLLEQTLSATVMSSVATVIASFALMALESPPENTALSFLSILQETCLKDDSLPSFSCCFLSQVLSAPQALKTIIVSNQQTAVIHTWFRCCVQIPTSSDHLQELSRLVKRLPEMNDLLKNLKSEAYSGPTTSEQVLMQFISALGLVYANINSLSEMGRFRELLAVYIGDILKYMEPVLSVGGPPDLLRISYQVSGSLVKLCPKALYIKTQARCLLPLLVDRLILPLLGSKQTLSPNILNSITTYLHQFLHGLASLDFKRDEFVKRKIKEVLSKYFLTFCQKFMQLGVVQPKSDQSIKNPFLIVLRDTFLPEPTQESSDFRDLLLMMIRENHLHLPQDPLKLVATLSFVNQLFQRTRCATEIARNTPVLITAVMSCLIACDVCTSSTEPRGVRKHANEILEMMIKSCREEPGMTSRETLLQFLGDVLASNLPQLQGKVFQSFATLAVLDQELITGLIPEATRLVKSCEQKRGVGTDSQLRLSYKNLLSMLGDRGSQEIAALSV